MSSVAIFIDGGYVEKLSADLCMGVIDYRALIKQITEKDDLLQTFYYNCLPYKSRMDAPTALYERKHKFFTALDFIPKTTVKLGRLIHCGQDRYQQKRVDTHLSVDMTMLVVTGRVDRIALIAGDDDYVPVVNLVKKAGIKFTLWYGDTTHSRASFSLLKLADETRLMCPDSMEHCVRSYGAMTSVKQNEIGGENHAD